MHEGPLELQLQTAEQALTNAYRERAHLVAFMTALYPASLAYSDPDTPGWAVVTIDLGAPGEQMSWHIAPDDLDVFEHLIRDDQEPGFVWDGHSTEEKYERLRARTAAVWQARFAPQDVETRAAADEPQEHPQEPQEPQEPVKSALPRRGRRAASREA